MSFRRPWSLKRMILPAISLTVALVWALVTLYAGWRALSLRQMEADILEVAEELERAKAESASEKKLWTTLPPSEFPVKIRDLIAEKAKNAKVEFVSPVVPFRIVRDQPGRSVEVSRWFQAAYVINVSGPIHHLLKFFHLLKKDAFVVEYSALTVKELEKGWTATAIVEFSGLGWPVEAPITALPQRVLDQVEVQAAAFDAKFQVAVKQKNQPVMAEKPLPPWTLIASAGGSIYLSQANPNEEGSPLTKILGQGDALYGWTVEISKDTIREGITLKKGSREIWWPMGGEFNGVEVKRKR